jgi:4-hydroxyphenylacetaldehyde oxime monooxygenase
MVAHKTQFHRVLDEALDLQATFSAEDFFPNAAGRLVDRLTGLVASRDRLFANIDAFFEMVIEHHLNPKREGSDLVDVLISFSKEQPDFTRDHVKAIIMVRAC